MLHKEPQWKVLLSFGQLKNNSVSVTGNQSRERSFSRSNLMARLKRVLNFQTSVQALRLVWVLMCPEEETHGPWWPCYWRQPHLWGGMGETLSRKDSLCQAYRREGRAQSGPGKSEVCLQGWATSPVHLRWKPS